MPCRSIFIIAALSLSLPIAPPRPCEAFEFFQRRHHHPAAYAGYANAVPRYQQASRWYPEYRPMPGDDYGGGVPTYAYGYFGAKSHSAHGWHHGYYGDLYMWGPLRGR